MFARVLLAVYVLAAALLPLAHHDVVCHLKSSTHCTTCVVGSSGETAAWAVALDGCAPADAGRAILPLGRLLSVRSRPGLLRTIAAPRLTPPFFLSFR